jgi:deoxyadenosine/deoxycytidine kinase
MDRPRHIVVEGPIGVGKTTLARMLAETLGARGIFEEPEANPFLSLFYKNQRKYAFQTQLFFLVSRYQQMKELAQQDLFAQSTVSDYLFEKDRIFARLTLDDHEYHLYEQIYALLDRDVVVKPDLVLFLTANPKVLHRRIRKRGTRIERDISEDYLEDLVQAYNRFFFGYEETPLLIVNTSDIDFVAHPDDYEGLVREIRTMDGGVKQYIPLGSR